MATIPRTQEELCGLAKGAQKRSGVLMAKKVLTRDRRSRVVLKFGRLCSSQCSATYGYIYSARQIPVVPHKAVAEVSKIGNL